MSLAELDTAMRTSGFQMQFKDPKTPGEQIEIRDTLRHKFVDLSLRSEGPTSYYQQQMQSMMQRSSASSSSGSYR